jgi:hypothetical protein
MAWTIVYHPAFEPEYEVLSEPVQDALVEAALVLSAIGPTPVLQVADLRRRTNGSTSIWRL